MIRKGEGDVDKIMNFYGGALVSGMTNFLFLDFFRFNKVLHRKNDALQKQGVELP